MNEVLINVAGGALMAVGGWALKELGSLFKGKARKAHNDADEEAIHRVVSESVDYADEWARSQLKINAKVKPDPSKKMEQAMHYIARRAEAPRSTLKITAEDRIHAELARRRRGGH